MMMKMFAIHMESLMKYTDPRAEYAAKVYKCLSYWLKLPSIYVSREQAQMSESLESQMRIARVSWEQYKRSKRNALP
jgi:hypothetical protein